MSNATVTTRSRRVADAPGLWQTIVGTDPGWGMPMLRLALGVLFFAHGSQKLLGWFGGPGYAGTMESLGEIVPGVVVSALIITEFFGSMFLFLGFLTRVASFAFITVMLGAISLVHAPHGFFMNWSGTQSGEGYEFHMLVIAMCLALLIRGGGSASVDLAMTDAERQ